MSPQIEKAQFQNTTDGYVGVVQIGVKGEPKGMPVAPGGTVWLSEDEQILTANAPRRPEDNPFVAQKLQRRHPETDALEEVEVIPLVPISENRYVPANLRPIGTSPQTAPSEPQGPVPASEAAPAAPVAASAPVAPPTAPPVPPRAAAAAAAADEAAKAAYVPPTPGTPTPPAADPQRVAPDDEGRVGDELAAASPGPASEETGAAVEPSLAAPVGEYQAGEEVGTPEAPARGEAASDDSVPETAAPESKD